MESCNRCAINANPAWNRGNVCALCLTSRWEANAKYQIEREASIKRYHRMIARANGNRPPAVGICGGANGTGKRRR